MEELLLVVVVLMVVVLLVVLVVCDQRRQTDFQRRFPPLSDAEFMARLPPGTDPAVALKVRRILAEQLGVDYERVHPEARLVEDLGAA